MKTALLKQDEADALGKMVAEQLGKVQYRQDGTLELAYFDKANRMINAFN